MTMSKNKFSIFYTFCIIHFYAFIICFYNMFCLYNHTCDHICINPLRVTGTIYKHTITKLVQTAIKVSKYIHKDFSSTKWVKHENILPWPDGSSMRIYWQDVHLVTYWTTINIELFLVSISISNNKETFNIIYETL